MRKRKGIRNTPSRRRQLLDALRPVADAVRIYSCVREHLPAWSEAPREAISAAVGLLRAWFD